MSKIILNIQLDPKEVFTEEFERALEAEAKAIARREFSSVMDREIRRIARAVVEEMCRSSAFGYTSGPVKARIDAAVAEAIVHNCVNGKNIAELVKEKLAEYAKHADKRMDEIDREIEKILTAKVRAAANLLLANGIAEQIFSATEKQ